MTLIEDIDFQHIEDRKNNNQQLHLRLISKVITTEVIIKLSFKNGEIIFGYLTNLFSGRKSKPKYEFNIMEAVAFQYAVNIIVRYLPTAEQPRYFLILL